MNIPHKAYVNNGEEISRDCLLDSFIFIHRDPEADLQNEAVMSYVSACVGIRLNAKP